MDEILHEGGIHPVKELMKLMPQLKPGEQMEVWMCLLSYIQPKPKEVGVTDEEDQRAKLEQLTREELVARAKELMPELAA